MGRFRAISLFLLHLCLVPFVIGNTARGQCEHVVLSLTHGAHYTVATDAQEPRMVITFPGMSVMELAESVHNQLGDDRKNCLITKLLCQATPDTQGAQLVTTFASPQVRVRVLKGAQSSQLMIHVQENESGHPYRQHQEKAVFYSSASLYVA